MADQAKNLLIECLEETFQRPVEDVDDLFYSVEESKQYKTVYFIKLNFKHPASSWCPLSKNKDRRHKGRSGRSYCVTVASGQVLCKCFSSKCYQVNNGKYVMKCTETSEEDEE